MESSLQNAFELLSFASTVVFARPEQFKFPATISAVAVALAGAVYAVFVRQRRGHLLHRSKCMGGDKTRQHDSEWLAESQPTVNDVPRPHGAA